ncbi:MAG: hypothetical protein U1E65_22935 [Myxococcota bacterium]
MRRLLFSLLAGLVGCGGGVPVQIRLDSVTVALSADDLVAAVEDGLRSGGLIAPESAGLPEVWPKELPDLCLSALVTPGDKDAIAIDLTPDPKVDPKAADLYQPVNDGTVDRIEIERVVLRVEENTLNFPLPPVELQAADDPATHSDDRRAWYGLGTLGGIALDQGCPKKAGEGEVVKAGEVKDVDFVFGVGGQSFLGTQLMDPDCEAHQMAAGVTPDPLKCKELALRARTRFTFDTRLQKEKPHGKVRLRFILVATFFVNPVD